MELKKYVRRGIISESEAYITLLRYDGAAPDKILLLLEGRARRRIRLTPARTLYENYYPEAFVGLEDYLLGKSRPGAAGVYPGSHYVLWNVDDFSNALSMQPELARRAIFELSRRIRIYDAHERTTDFDLRQDREIEVGTPDAELADALYEMSFADEDNFPPHLVEKLKHTFQAGDFLMKQDESSFELYILLSGRVSVHQTTDGERRKIDELGAGDMVGEMAQFDRMPRSADVVAEEAVEALVFAPEDFHMLFQLHPRWTQQLLTTLAQRVEQRRQAFESADLQNFPKPDR